MEYSSEALGSAIRSRRQECGLSQETLGREAGYGAGAGVAISRIESGLTRPSGERLMQIAKALETTGASLILEAKLLDEADQQGDGRSSVGLSTRDRFERVEKRLQERVETVERLGNSVNANQIKARDEFFLPFVEVANQIEDAPAVDQPDPGSDGGFDRDGREQPSARVQYRVRLARAGLADALKGGLRGGVAGAGVGGGAAFATFSLAAAYGTASTGTAIAGLAGAAASNATFALIGGGSLAAGGLGIAGGTAILSAIVAGPAALLAMGGAAIWLHKKRGKATEQLMQAEQQLEHTEDRYQAMVTMLKRSDTVLEQIAVFAVRALRKWQQSLPVARPVAWGDLTVQQQQSYEDFLSIAACHLSVASIKPETFMAEDSPLDDLVRESSAVLDDADRVLQAV
jgi:transcriptional regulator with XRE-family HTH domain